MGNTYLLGTTRCIKQSRYTKKIISIGKMFIAEIASTELDCNLSQFFKETTVSTGDIQNVERIFLNKMKFKRKDVN